MAMETPLALGITVIISLFAFVIGVSILSLFLLWAAKIAGIEGRSFGRAFGATILTGIASFIFSLLTTLFLPGLSVLINFLAGFVVHALVIMPVFRTTFGKALGAAVLAWILSILVFGGLALLAIIFFGAMQTSI